MNSNILAGNDALRNGDLSGATEQFLLAAEDDDPLVRRIARNRLYEIHPEEVYASTHSYQALYHRQRCPAKNVTRRHHIIWFKNWRDAEAAGFQPCGQCKPLRVVPDLASRALGSH